MLASSDLQVSYIKSGSKKQMQRQVVADLPVSLVFNIKGGDISFVSNRDKIAVLNDRDSCNVFYVPVQDCQLRWELGVPIELFEIRIPLSMLRMILPDDQQVWVNFAGHLGGTQMQALSGRPLKLTAEMKEILYNLRTPKFESPSLQKRYVHCAVLQLLLLLFDKSIQEEEVRPPSEKELVLANKVAGFLDSFPGREDFSILGLAADLQTNETTLKQGFKKVFDTTIYTYYNRLRMEKARQLLLEGHSVTETTMLIGYKQVSHFSYAFKKFYGFLPSVVYK